MSKIKLLIIIGAAFIFLYGCNGGTQHTHEFENGKCECGEMDPNHIHDYIDGECSCGETDPNYVVHIHEYIEGRCECGNVDVSHLLFENATYLYDGSKHEVLVEGELPEGVSIEYINNSLTNAGSTSAQANVIYKNDVIKTLNATLTVNKRNVTLKALDVDALRGSNPVNHGYSVIEGEILNSDLSKINPTILIDSVINQNSEVGLYENVISISFIPNENYNINIINGNYKIYTNTFNIDELNISNKDVIYDGEKHLINISNLPSFIDVEYYYNNELTDGLVDAGVYEIKMIFTSNSVEYTLNKTEITKTLTIEKKKVEGSILPTSVNYLEDLTLAHFDIKWDNLILDKDYDLFNFVYKIDESLGNFPNVGEYSNVIDLIYTKNENYEITIKKGSLLVNKIEFNKETIEFNDQTFSYDGLEHTLLMENELPSDFTITYTNNIQKDPGIYNVSLTISSPNYYEIDTFNATLEILKDGKYHDVTFKQGDESLVNIVVQNNTLITNIPEIIGINGYSSLWDFDFNTLVQSDLLIGLSFTPITYNITYFLDGGINNSLNPSTYTIEDEITLLEPLKRGYTFTGWYLEEEFINEIETIELGSIEDIYLYAKFDENIYNLNYYVGNELIDTEEVIFNSTYSIKEVTPYGDEYEIFKWMYNDEVWNTSSIIIYNYDYDIDLYGEIAYIGSDYYYTLDENTASIDSYSGTIENLIIPKFIKNNNQYYSVKTIGEDAFYGCSSLTSIVIPNSVTSIGSYAFYNCSSLENVYYSGTIDDWCNIEFYDFYSNPMLEATYFFMLNESNEYFVVTDLVIPDSITSIGDYQFQGFNILASITISNSVKSIGLAAFYNCSSLASITIPNSVTSIGSAAFGNCSSLASIIVDENNSVYDSRNNCNSIIETHTNILIVGCKNTVIPDSVTSIGSYAFYDCSSLESITIPNSVTSIGSYAFEDCSSLASITIPNSVTSIGSSAFAGCSSLENITMPNSVTSIASSTFAYCSSLASITIPNSVTSIGYYAFLGCSSLENITIPKSVPNIGERAFYGCNNLENVYYYGTIEDWCGSIFRDVSDNPMSYAEHFYMLNDEGEWEEVIDISIPDSVTTISQYIFHGFDNIISITIPNSVISIGSNAFSNCISLESIVIPDSVTSIGSEILYSCYSLKFITLPFLGKEIDEQYSYFGYIFGATSCFNQYRNIPNSLREVIITGGTFIADTAFYNCSSLESITIPNSVTIIGVQAFYDCSSLESITIPNSVTSIGDGSFSDCSSLASIVIPDSVTSIGYSAFYGCSNLTIYCETISKPSGWNSDWNSSNRPVVWEYDSSKMYIDTSFVYLLDNEYNSATIVSYIGSSNNVEISNSIIINNIEYVIKNIGSSAFRSCNKLTSVVIPNSVTSIGSSAFIGCSSLTSIVIPDSVTSIGSSAFYGCSSLVSIEITDSVTSIGYNAFYDCSKLTSIVIPDSVTSIGYNAFYGCSKLTSIVIPDSVTSIGLYAFYNCSSLTIYCEAISKPSGWSSKWNNSGRPVVWGYDSSKIYIDTSFVYLLDNEYNSATIVSYIGSSNNIEISNSIIINNIEYIITNIEANAFRSCNKLTSVVIPNSFTNIGDGAFSGCSSLTSVIIPNSVTSIGSSAFSGCSSLVSIEIPDSVTSIGYNAFYDCSKLTSIVIPDSVTSIGYNAFSNCSSLTIYCEAISKPSGWSLLWNYSNRPVVWRYDSSKIYIDTSFVYLLDNEYNSATIVSYIGSSNNIEISNIIIINNIEYIITNIGEGAFLGCESLTEIVIPDSVTSIGSNAFYNCSSLTSIVIPSSVTSIGSYAFEDCRSLASIAIPNSVTSIGSYAFYNCSSLESIIIDENNSVYDSRNNCNAIIKTNTNNLIVGCKNTIIPDSVTSIGSNAFYGCSSLENIVIPNSVTSIGFSAFRDCSSLTIYCEATSKPSGWDYDWNYSNRPIVWGYTNE